jgi:hypothetical protein
VELVALVIVALAFMAKPLADEPAKGAARTATGSSAATATTAAGTTAAAPARPEDPPAQAELPRREVGVLVLNGNGISGSAAAKAATVRRFHYPVLSISDADQRDFPRTIVMYRNGFRGEGERLATDLGLPRQRAMPLDGIRASTLDGAKLVVVVGNSA